MFKKVLVSNFKSLEKVDLRLDPLTVLVGPNGSGKSNLVDALHFLADCMQLGLEGAINRRSGIRAVRRWSSGRPFNLEIEVGFDVEGQNASYGFCLTGDQSEDYRVKWEYGEISSTRGKLEFRYQDAKLEKGPADLRPPVDPLNLAMTLIGGDKRFQPLSRWLRNIACYSVFPNAMRDPQKYNPQKPMQEHGENWVSILKDQPEHNWKAELLAALGKLTGDIEDLRIAPVGSYLTVQFKHRAGQARRPKWLDASQESDGTLRVAAIVTALLQEPPLPFVAIEEPELTVHPGAIPMIFDFIKQASKRSQVVITTHSPELLDLIDEEVVRVVERHEGATTISALEANQKARVKQRLQTLGEVMRSEGMKQQGLPLSGEELSSP